MEQPDLSKYERLDPQPVINPGAAATPGMAPPSPLPPPIGPNPFMRSPLAPQMWGPVDASKAFDQNGRVPQVRTIPRPPASNPQANAAAQSQVIAAIAAGAGPTLLTNNQKNAAQNRLNLVGTGITADAFGDVFFTSVTDGIVHGDTTDWYNDSAFAFWRDDFNIGTGLANTNNGTSTIGELHWDAVNTAGSATSQRICGSMKHPGQLFINTGSFLASHAAIYAPFAGQNSANGFQGTAGTLPLLDYPGWKIVWQFLFPINRETVQLGGLPSPFPLTKAQIYAGLTTAFQSSTWNPGTTGNNVLARPPYFVGLRYDTDPGVTYTLSSVATASGGTTVYTGTLSGLASTLNNSIIGNNITVAGFTNGPNNGAFQCVGQTTTTLTLLNPSGVAETHAATATIPAIGDSTFKFETVANFNFNQVAYDNTQGSVVDTGITPVEGGAYRLELLYTTRGTVQMTLTGGLDGAGATFTTTLPVPKASNIGTGSNQLGVAAGNGIGLINGTNGVSGPFVNFGNCNFTATTGTIITIAGLTGAAAALNGTQMGYIWSGGDLTYVFPSSATFNFTNTPGATLTYYPGLTPYFAAGNDTHASPPGFTIAIDFFSLVINPGLAGESLAPNNARYW